MSISGTKPQPAAHREPATEHIQIQYFLSFFFERIFGEVPPQCISGRKDDMFVCLFETTSSGGPKNGGAEPFGSGYVESVGFPGNRKALHIYLVVSTQLKKICSSNWIISPGRDENKKCLRNHHLVTSFPENYNSLKRTAIALNKPFGPQKGRKPDRLPTNKFQVLSFVSFRKSSQK